MPTPALAALVALVALTGEAEPVAEPAVPDASLRAMTGSVVRLELDEAPAVEGKLVAFEPEWVTVISSANDEVISVPRAKLLHLRALQPPALPQRQRIIGAHFGASVSLAVDAQWKLFYAFANGNILFPLTTLTGSTTAWMAFSVGAGVSLPLQKASHWRADLFAQVLPLHVGGSYSYVGLGVGAGLRYAGDSGFTFALKVPIVGYAVRAGRSPNGYDPAFRPAYAFGYYYLAALMGMPLVSVGYRF